SIVWYPGRIVEWRPWMDDVVNESALQNESRVLSVAPLANSSVATQSLSTPIKAMYWIDAQGQTLAGYATYGSSVSLCITTQVFNISIDVKIVVRHQRGGTYQSMMRASFPINWIRPFVSTSIQLRQSTSSATAL